MIYKRQSQQAGFTLIELMIASAVFVTVTVTGVAVLLNATNNYRTTSEIRQSLDTLSFVMEDMTRNIRLGTKFHAVDWNNIDQFNACEVNTSSAYGQMCSGLLAMESVDGDPDPQHADDQIIYWISGASVGDTEGTLYKKSMTGQWPPSAGCQGVYANCYPQTFSPITPANVHLDLLKSGFSVSIPDPLMPPVVTIRLAGYVEYRATKVPFDIQSSVAPRTIPGPSGLSQ